MWSLQHEREFQATAETVWAWYEDTASAPSWDPLIGEIRCDGPLAVGVTGRNKPRRGPSAPFVYTEVTPGVSYTEETKLPGARMAFWHTLQPRGDGTVVTHGVTCTGPLARLYQLFVRRSFDAGMVQALDGLAALAQAGPPTAVR